MQESVQDHLEKAKPEAIIDEVVSCKDIFILKYQYCIHIKIICNRIMLPNIAVDI